MAARHWTPEQRAKQSAAIHDWKPWKNSTGARTSAGKTKSYQKMLIRAVCGLLCGLLTCFIENLDTLKQ